MLIKWRFLLPGWVCVCVCACAYVYLTTFCFLLRGISYFPLFFLCRDHAFRMLIPVKWTTDMLLLCVTKICEFYNFWVNEDSVKHNLLNYYVLQLEFITFVYLISYGTQTVLVILSLFKCRKYPSYMIINMLLCTRMHWKFNRVHV